MQRTNKDVTSLFSDLGETDANPVAYRVDGVAPKHAVFPRTVDSMAETLRRAHAEELSVAPWGGGTKITLGNLPRRLDVVVGTSRLDAMLDHQPANLTVTVQAGVALASLQAVLKKHGQFVPLESPLADRATIGGVLATNVNGPLRLAYGTARDWLIGARVVHADGIVTKAGGKVVKNVTGYDLNKLYVGSLGTLGILVEASLKVAPLPPVRRTLTAHFASLQDACQAALVMDRQGLGLSAAVALDSNASKLLQEYAPPVRGGGAMLAVEVRGRRFAVERREADLRSALVQGGSVRCEALGSAAEAFWQAVVDLGWQEADASAVVVRCAVSPSEIGPLPQHVYEAFQPSGLLVALAVEPAVGVLRAVARPEAGAPVVPEAVAAAVASLRQAVIPSGGYVVVERCEPAVKALLDIWGQPQSSIELMRQMKKQFDPTDALNPGRFAGGI